MQVKLKPWGNSQGIRFSKAFLESVGIMPDDTLSVETADGKIILRRASAHRSLEERAAEYGGQLNLKGVEKKADEQLRKILGVPDNEEIIMIIAAGYPIEEFTYVTSVRNPIEESLVMVN